MLDTERDEFERQMSVLCAGFNVPMRDQPEAFWRVCRRWQLSEFVRTVDAVLGAGEFDKMPTVAQFQRYRGVVTKTGQAAPPGRQAALVEYVLRHRKISDRQKSKPWNWLTKSWPDPRREDATRQAHEIFGVIVPQDEQDPATYPAHRVLFDDVEWQQYLEPTIPMAAA